MIYNYHTIVSNSTSRKAGRGARSCPQAASAMGREMPGRSWILAVGPSTAETMIQTDV